MKQLFTSYFNQFRYIIPSGIDCHESVGEQRTVSLLIQSAVKGEGDVDGAATVFYVFGTAFRPEAEPLPYFCYTIHCGVGVLVKLRS